MRHLPAHRPPGELKKHIGAVHVKGKLSLLQRKVSNVLLLNAYDQLPDDAVSEHRIELRTLADAAGFDSNDHELLRSALEALVDVKIRWNILSPEGEEEWGVSTFLAQAVTRGGVCYYAYAPGLRRRLFNPSIYARINLGVQERFASSYALALYENCVRFRKVGSTGWLALETWRDLLGVGEGQYEEFKYLKRSVLKPAVEEVNAHSDIRVTLEAKRKKRRVVALKFAIEENAQLHLELAAENASAGRELSAARLPDPVTLAPSPDELLDPLQKRLTTFGLTTAQALDLATEYAADRIERNLDHVTQALGGGRSVRSVPAFTIEAIRKDYAASAQPPASASPGRAAAPRRAASDIGRSPEARRAEQRRAEQEKRIQADAERAAHYDDRWNALSEAARRAIEDQAVLDLEKEDAFVYGLYRGEQERGEAPSLVVRTALRFRRDALLDAKHPQTP
jgi:hypothetical protein